MKKQPSIELLLDMEDKSTIEEPASAMEESTQEESCTISEPSPSSSSLEEQYGAGAKRRRKKSRKTFFEGEACKPYRVRKSLRRFLEDNHIGIDCVCKQCAAVQPCNDRQQRNCADLEGESG